MSSFDLYGITFVTTIRLGLDLEREDGWRGSERSVTPVKGDAKFVVREAFRVRLRFTVRAERDGERNREWRPKVDAATAATSIDDYGAAENR